MLVLIVGIWRSPPENNKESVTISSSSQHLILWYHHKGSLVSSDVLKKKFKEFQLKKVTMAEAVVEDPHRFFCHKCSVEIPRVLPDYTCPNCCSGFIEALDSEAAQNEQGEESEDEVDVVQPWEILNDVFLMGMNGESIVDLRRPGGRGRRGRDGDRRPGRNVRTRHAVENLLHLFVMNWSGNGRGSLGGGRGGAGGPEFFLGNPGDYAWGREGLDAIVTQLLNQMDAAGPPPLTKEKIEEIPVVVITQEQVDIALQCSVCWENFKVEEPVRRLFCTHVYHEGCIIPWLELHGTCPICRKPQSSEAEEAAGYEDGAREQTLASFAAELSQPLNHSQSTIGDAISAALFRSGRGNSGNSSSLSSNAVRGSRSGTGPTTSTSAEVPNGNSGSGTSGSSSGSSSSQPNSSDMDVD